MGNDFFFLAQNHIWPESLSQGCFPVPVEMRERSSALSAKEAFLGGSSQVVGFCLLEFHQGLKIPGLS